MDSNPTQILWQTVGPLDVEREEIRLLTIKPTLESGGVLECELSTRALTNRSPYFALSYMWGDPAETIPIKINGLVHQITKNLHAALTEIHAQGVASSVPIWVDAVCIDQGSIGEKNYQVPLMSKIYAGAFAVLVWLGEEEEDSDLAMGLIERWGAAITDNVDGFKAEAPLETFQAHVKTIPNAFVQEDWIALRKLLTRPYWKRIWTLQEVVLARNVTLLCGSSSVDYVSLLLSIVPWNRIEAGVLFDDIDSSLYQTTGLVQSALRGVVFAHTALTMFRIAQAEQLTLSFLAFFTDRFLSTDPRDKVYALFGLLASGEPPFQPDYNLSTSQVYSKFVLTDIQLSSKLNVLSAAGTGLAPSDSSLDLPSWIPHLESAERKTPKLSPEYYKTSNSTSPNITISDNLQELSAEGVIWDEIVEVDADTPTDSVRDVLGRWLIITLNQTERFHPSGIPWLQALFRTLIPNLSRDKADLDNSSMHDETEFFDLACGFFYNLGMLSPWHNPTPEFFAQLGVTREEIDKLKDLFAEDSLPDYVKLMAFFIRPLPDVPLAEFSAAMLEPFCGAPSSPTYLEWPSWDDKNRGQHSGPKFDRAVESATAGRAFFTTSKGYIGLGPSNIAAGDKVCVLLGSNLPMVIQPTGEGQYLLVGACFVYGIMKGEVLQEVEKGSLHTEQLRFC